MCMIIAILQLLLRTYVHFMHHNYHMAQKFDGGKFDELKLHRQYHFHQYLAIGMQQF